MSTQSPTVSVAIAVYNAECYVSEAIDSILNQTFTDFELLIIDDGSTDGSLKILQDYAARDDRINLTSQKNQGIARSRNTLLRQARGEFIAVMDADDIAMPERFARQVDFLNRATTVVCLGSAYNIVDGAGTILDHIQFPPHNDEIQQKLLSGVTAIHHPTSMVRRAAMLEIGGYDETMQAAIDLDICLRLGEIGDLANLSDTLLHYRMHSGSISERRRKQQAKDAQEACERAWKRRGIQGTYQVTEVWRHHLILRYGWELFMAGHRRLAIAHGIRAVRLMPFRLDSWKLFIGAMIKPLI